MKERLADWQQMSAASIVSGNKRAASNRMMVKGMMPIKDKQLRMLLLLLLLMLFVCFCLSAEQAVVKV